MTSTYLANFTYIIFLIFFGYFLLLMFYYLLLAFIALIEGKKRSWQNEIEDYSLLYFSSFTVPISIIIPAHNEEGWIRDCLLSVLNINYPEFEVVIVDDGSTDKTLEILSDTLHLKPVHVPYIKHFQDGVVQTIFKSEKHPNVTVITKSAGNKKAGAVNAGLNIAKYKYVCPIDADTILEPDALLRVMAHVEKDPDRIIGISSYFGLANGLKIKDGRILEHSFSYRPIIAYQNLEYIRSLIGNRIAWSKLNAMPNVAGGFGVWRRDILYILGGYSAEFTCEDIELTFRAQDYIVKNKDKGYKILMLPYHIGWTEGPSNIFALISQRNRWQRVTNETIWRYKYMMCNPRFGIFAFFVFPYFVLYEVLGVFFEVASIAMVALGYIYKILDVKVFLGFLLLMILSQGVVSLLSILAFVRSQKIFKPKYVAYLMFLSMAEFLWYRWIISIAKLLGTFDYLRKVKSYDQYKREKRNNK